MNGNSQGYETIPPSTKTSGLIGSGREGGLSLGEPSTVPCSFGHGATKASRRRPDPEHRDTKHLLPLSSGRNETNGSTCGYPDTGGFTTEKTDLGDIPE